jgi:two-component system OmpR family sensor kinase
MRRFVADASHELRTPLTSIRGFAELQRQQGPDRNRAEADRMLERIESESRRMTELVEDLLRLARLDGHRPIAHVPVDLMPIVADAAFDAHSLAPDRVVQVDLPDGGDAGPVIVAGDDAQLREVLGNLVNNALVHTPPGTPVRIALRAEDRDEGPVAVVDIVDEGPGMTAEHASHVFERFYRTDASRTRAAGGSGLGLSIVGAIVEAHGGRVELYTSPGEGCTFRVVLGRVAAA